jgi:Hypothetical glycosyl hydrolase family 15
VKSRLEWVPLSAVLSKRPVRNTGCPRRSRRAYGPITETELLVQGSACPDRSARPSSGEVSIRGSLWRAVDERRTTGDPGHVLWRHVLANLETLPVPRTVRASALLAALLAALAFGILTGLDETGRATASSVATRPSGPLAGVGVSSLGGTLANVAGASGFGVVIGDANDADQLAALPGLALAYFSGTDINTHWSTGVSYSEAAANGWLLTDSSGDPLLNKSYADDYIGDVGNSGYQQAWIANVLQFLGAHPGLDGVFIDDVLYDLEPMTGAEAARYPDQPDWAAAQLSFVAAVGQALKARGYYVLVNASGYIPGEAASDDGGNTVAWWRQLGPYVNGLMNENYQQVPDGSDAPRASGPAWTQNWDGWQQLLETAQSMGNDFYGLDYGGASDAAAIDYGRASFLLDWNGGGGAFMYSDPNGSDVADSALTTDIGEPAGVKEQIGAGWMREYTAGIALVNPDPDSSQTFDLGGTYLAPDGEDVSSVTLPPTSGMILSALQGTVTSPQPEAVTGPSTATTPATADATQAVPSTQESTSSTPGDGPSTTSPATTSPATTAAATTSAATTSAATTSAATTSAATTFAATTTTSTPGDGTDATTEPAPDTDSDIAPETTTTDATRGSSWRSHHHHRHASQPASTAAGSSD